MTKQPKGTPTDTNIFALASLANGQREFANRVAPTDAPHIRRCAKAGLVEVVSRDILRLTDAGVAAINARAARVSTTKPVEV